MSTQRVGVATDPPYEVIVGAGALAQAGVLLESYERCALLADARVDGLHGERLHGLSFASKLTLEPGEQAKSLSQLEGVLDFMAAARLDRSSLLVTFGGGVVSDLGGLAASLFKRGLDVVHLPTTLLAQVDASVGGKTAVNLAAGKNLAGTFHQPRGVICDTSTLATLDANEYASGLGEVIKTAMIGGETSLADLEAAAPALIEREAGALAKVVAGCVATKARIVAEDPDEKGPRRVLNLGHTLGHAIEAIAGYGVLPHGAAVAVGIGFALELALRCGVLQDEGLVERYRQLAHALGLPTKLSQLEESAGICLEAGALVDALAHDKKGKVGVPEFVLPKAVADFELGVRVEREMLLEQLARS
ncbi:MAG: 3-dehydroquinate synthase [Planctomycetota bacterium]